MQHHCTYWREYDILILPCAVLRKESRYYMSDVKKDTNGRILRKGERQRKDGRYEFRYKDETGVTRSVYSWRLVGSDRSAHSPNDVPLRDLEKQIRRDLEDSISAYRSKRDSLNYYFDLYMSTKTELKESTRTNYLYMYNRFVKDSLGIKPLADIKYSDVKKFYLSLINERGLKPNTMEIVNTVLHPVFGIAVRDGYIRLNPTDGAMLEIKRSNGWEKAKRHPLTEQQQTAFVNYCKNSKTYRHWMPLFTFLLGTGCRIGEALGLRWEDCDFKNGVISINHSILYRPVSDGSGNRLMISTPKTKSGVRQIPMFDEVKAALLENVSINPNEVDGYRGFVFINMHGGVMTPASVNRAIDRICRDYNKEETARAEKERRKAQLLPHFSAHTLRHTFCTRLCENETNLKIIQEIMGHADISTTMNVYNEATIEKKIESFYHLQGKFSIG